MTRFFHFQFVVQSGLLALGMLTTLDHPVFSQGQPAGPQRPIQQPAGSVQPAQGPQRPPIQQQPAGPALPQQGPPAAVAPVPKAPEWFPLPADQEKYLTDILVYWEKSSARVQRYRCKFNRWTYDPTFTKRDATGELPAKIVSSGEIKYAAPDKGLFREDKIEHYARPKAEGEKGKYEITAGEKGDHWVCDGKSIFLFDYPNKKLVQTELPPGMQGKAIVDGPLPFMFGAEAAKVKERFWVRVITPPEVTTEYWLEAFPKSREDAANFKLIRIIIDILEIGTEKYALPKAMAIYDRSPSYQSFAFEGRIVNWSTIPDQLNPFYKEFYEPSTPPGFKKMVERYQPGGAAQKVANAGAKVLGPPPPNANGQPPKGVDPTLYYSKEPAKR